MKHVFLKLNNDTFESVNEVGVTTRETQDDGTHVDTTYYLEYSEEEDKLMAYEVIDRNIYIDKFIELEHEETYEVIDIIEDTRPWVWAQEQYESTVKYIGEENIVTTPVAEDVTVNQGDDIETIINRSKNKVKAGKKPPANTRPRKKSTSKEKTYSKPSVDLSDPNISIEDAIEAAAQLAMDEAIGINGLEDDSTINYDVDNDESEKPVKRKKYTKKKKPKAKSAAKSYQTSPKRSKRNNPAPQVEDFFEDDGDYDEEYYEEEFDDETSELVEDSSAQAALLQAIAGGKSQNRSKKRNKSRRIAKSKPVANGSFGNITALQSLDENFIFENAQLLLALQNMDENHKATLLNVMSVLTGGSDKNVNVIFA